MIETRNRIDGDQTLTQVGRLFPNPEAKKPETAVPKQPIQREFITNYALPDEIVQTLTNAFDLLGLQLELLETFDPLVGDHIQHHKLRSAAGDIALIYSEANLIQIEDKLFVAQLNSLGMLFSREYSSIFIFSHAGNTSFRYKEMLRQWIEDLKFFSRAEFFLEDAITAFKESDANVVVNYLKSWLGLSEQAGAQPKKERVNTRKLLKFIDEHFNDDEIRTLCMGLPVDYENLAGDTREGKIRELILDAERDGYFDELIKHCREDKKNLSWDEVYE